MKIFRLLVIALSLLLVLTAGLLWRSANRNKTLIESSRHDETILLCTGLFQILDHKEFWAEEKARAKVLWATREIYSSALQERECFRHLGLVNDSDPERMIDAIIERQESKFHKSANQPVESD